ncbi:hypothetical protein [Wolbachia pipientis]
MNLLYITHYPKSCATKPTGIQFLLHNFIETAYLFVVKFQCQALG